MVLGFSLPRRDSVKDRVVCNERTLSGGRLMHWKKNISGTNDLLSSHFLEKNVKFVLKMKVDLCFEE